MPIPDSSLNAQDDDFNILVERFLKLYNSGDLVSAENCLLLILNSKNTLSEEDLIAIYNNLGITCAFSGKYDEALDYYSRAENLIINYNEFADQLAKIYNNKAIIYGYLRSYSLAIEYLEKSIRIYLNQKSNEEDLMASLSSAYLNIGIAYLESGDFKSALDYLNKSSEIKLKFNLTGLSLVNLNLAKTYVKTGNPLKAEDFYLKSISLIKNKFGEDYYRLAEVYCDYGLFLRSVEKNDESLVSLTKALSIFRKYYGDKHTLVSKSYRLIGDHYKNLSDYNSSLAYYQKALIAVVNDFNDTNIFSNPSINSALFDIRLLENLKSKSQALELLAYQQNDPEMKLKTLNNSFETIDLALQLIDRLRNNYPSEESQIYLAENEKETYVFATHLAFSLYSLSHDEFTGEKMYGVAKKAKAAILRNDISGNELLWSANIPDSLRTQQNIITGNIAAYNYLILSEMREADSDSNKIAMLKDALFEMNRKSEKITSDLNNAFPQYSELLQKTEPISLNRIQEQLASDESVIDYLLSNQYIDGKRKLYIFIITKDRLEFKEKNLDSLFIKNAQIIRKGDNPDTESRDHKKNFNIYTGALYYMYENLIKPVEEFFSGNKLIIIPDEEISWLPFEAFLKSKPGLYQTDYEGLPYLIYDYTFSYGYSSSLIFSNDLTLNKGGEVYSFLPEYGENSFSGKEFESLRGAGEEIESIYKWFDGKKFTGNQATEKNFREAIKNPVIFHLAMHALTDSTNSRYSFFQFSAGTDPLEDGRLYNYEISLSRLKSPMVVLSACNSGSGTLYQGEGMMSLSRGFILAGASSVIKTAWEVNDEVSADIITRFYYHLSKGKPKDEAMRLAKLEYLKGSSPSLTNPYFWAAYEIMGDNAPVTKNNRNIIMLISGIILLALTGLLIFYLRRRRIFSDRLL